MIAAHVIATLTFFFISNAILISIYPIIFYFIFNERILHFGIELPLIDWKCSWIGYGVNFTHVVVCLAAFTCLSIYILTIIICFMTSAIVQFDFLDILLHELNDLAITNEDGRNNEEICKKIKLLTQTHEKLVEFMDELRETFAPYYFFEFGALIFQKTVVLFAMITVSYLLLSIK